MAKIVTLGEIMLRLSPMGNDRFIQSDSFRIIPGGGEANVAISVANYGHGKRRIFPPFFVLSLFLDAFFRKMLKMILLTTGVFYA